MAELDYKRLRDRLRGQPVTPIESNLPKRPDSLFETEATKANAVAGGGLIGAGAGLRASWDQFKNFAENYENPIWKAGQVMRSGFTGEQPATPNTLIPSPAEEAARRQTIAAPNTIARPEGTANLQPNTGTVELPPVGTPQQIEKERIARIAGRISTENPYGGDVTSPALRTNQVGIGAATAAEAARNLQDRALQDQATTAEVQRLNRATDAMRELRAARRGVPVSELDSVQKAAPEVRNPFALPGDAFGDDVMRRNRLMSAIENPEGETLRSRKANQAAAVETFKSFMEGGQQPTRDRNAINPLDMGRFLLDQQKAVGQLGIDKARLGIEQGTLASKQAETGIKQQEYTDKAKKEFMDTVQLGVPPEYQPQIASSIFQMAQSTGGVIPPEVMAGDYMNFAKANDLNFEDMKPADLLEFNKKFMAYQTSRYGSK